VPRFLYVKNISNTFKILGEKMSVNLNSCFDRSVAGEFADNGNRNAPLDKLGNKEVSKAVRRKFNPGLLSKSFAHPSEFVLCPILVEDSGPAFPAGIIKGYASSLSALADDRDKLTVRADGIGRQAAELRGPESGEGQKENNASLFFRSEFEDFPKRIVGNDYLFGRLSAEILDLCRHIFNIVIIGKIAKKALYGDKFSVS